MFNIIYEMRRDGEIPRDHLDGADFSGLNLACEDLSGQSAKGANFTSCNLFQARMIGMKFDSKTIFNGANIGQAAFSALPMENLKIVHRLVTKKGAHAGSWKDEVNAEPISQLVPVAREWHGDVVRINDMGPFGLTVSSFCSCKTAASFIEKSLFRGYPTSYRDLIDLFIGLDALDNQPHRKGHWTGVPRTKALLIKRSPLALQGAFKNLSLRKDRKAPRKRMQWINGKLDLSPVFNAAEQQQIEAEPTLPERRKAYFDWLEQVADGP